MINDDGQWWGKSMVNSGQWCLMTVDDQGLMIERMVDEDGKWWVTNGYGWWLRYWLVMVNDGRMVTDDDYD